MMRIERRLLGLHCIATGSEAELVLVAFWCRSLCRCSGICGVRCDIGS